MFNPEIFKAYDIRGIYGRDFDVNFAFKLGAVLVRFVNRKRFLVANDGRDFSPELARSLMEGITSAGGDAYYIGSATMPFFYFIFGKLGVNGGVMVTASHNGPEYGGFKIFGENCGPIALNSGLGPIRDLISGGDFETSKYGGRIYKPDRREFLEKYMRFVIKKSGVQSEKLKVLKIAARGNELVKEEINLLFAKLDVRGSEDGPDVTFSLDGDADRLLVFDNNGHKINPDLVLGLLAKERIKFFSKPKVAYDLRFSKGVLDKFREWGIKSFRSRVGRTFIREAMVNHKADIGGELSGHLLFKENNYLELPLMMMLRILKIMAQRGRDISRLVEEFKTWFNSGEINITFNVERSAFRGISEKLKERYKDGEIDELDGITVEFPDWWFNLRPSNTEPMVRLIVEAKSKELLDQRVGELTVIIKNALGNSAFSEEESKSN
jgi:phosphomannomutase